MLASSFNHFAHAYGGYLKALELTLAGRCVRPSGFGRSNMAGAILAPEDGGKLYFHPPRGVVHTAQLSTATAATDTARSLELPSPCLP